MEILIKHILLILSLIFSLSSFAIVSSGGKITAKKFNESTLSVGTIQQSLLTEAQFQLLQGNCWVKMIGQDVTGSDYASITERNILPDARGRFARNLGTGTAPIAGTQNDSTAVNGLTIASSGNHKHDSLSSSAGKRIAYYSSSRGTANPKDLGSNILTSSSGNAGVVAETTTNGSHTHSLSGESETRPDNFTVNMFIKINHECN